MKLVTLASTLALALAATAALAATPAWSNHPDRAATIADKNAHLSGNVPAFVPHASGDNISNALPITFLPFHDNASSCDYTDDYDEVCPYSYSTSPDAVYSFSPTSSTAIDIDLCASLYDTKVYVFDGSPSTVIACNDDAYCGITGYQSKLTNVPVVAGHTYYIVVDGYGGDCGTYDLIVSEHVSCTPCAAVDQVEGEPACSDGYSDTYNGGCNATTPVFTPVTCGEICGTTGTFLVDGLNYRDTDWYMITVGAGTFTYSGIGDGFELQLLLMEPTCPSTVIDYAIPSACTTGSVTFTGPGTFFLWAGPSTYSGVPCGSRYHLSITGPGIPSCEPTPTHRSSWGQLKTIYR